AEMLVERSGADGARTVLAQIHDPVALSLELCVLSPQRVALRLRFLPVAPPLGPPRLQTPETLLELLPLRLDGDGGFLLHHRRVEDPRATFPEARELIEQESRGFHQRLPPPLFAREAFESLELLGDFAERFQLRRER